MQLLPLRSLLNIGLEEIDILVDNAATRSPQDSHTFQGKRCCIALPSKNKAFEYKKQERRVDNRSPPPPLVSPEDILIGRPLFMSPSQPASSDDRSSMGQLPKARITPPPSWSRKESATGMTGFLADITMHNKTEIQTREHTDGRVYLTAN